MRYVSILFVLFAVQVALAQDPLDDLLEKGEAKSAPSTADAPAKTDAPPAADAAKADGAPAPEPDAAAEEEATEEEADDTSIEREESGIARVIKDVTSAGALGLFLEGGIFMWPILLMAIIGLGVIIERYRSLTMLSSDTSSLRDEVQDLLQQDRVEDALNLCDGQEGPVPAVLAAGLRKFMVLRRLHYDPAQIQEQVNKAMEDYSIHIVAALERHLPVLATIASVAPMLGFLGTVSGMITSFKDIVRLLGEVNIIEAAAGGISVALLTTCFGLIVGIPAYMAYNYFNGIINRNVLDVEESATELIEGVTFQMALEK